MIQSLKRELAFFLALVMFVSLSLPTFADSPSDSPVPIGFSAWYEDADSGVGDSAENPYEIGTADELAYFATLVNNTASKGGAVSFEGKTITLTADIDLSDYANWTPIGNSTANAFKGTFDGDGYTVTNLKITGSSTYRGLFGYVNGCTVKNLGLSGIEIKSGNYAGGLIASATSATIMNSYVTGEINGASNIGGMVAMTNYVQTTITNCYTNVSVAGTGGNLGGIVGNGVYTMTNCYAMGPVSGSTVTSVGGLAGSGSASGSITNCAAINESLTIAATSIGTMSRIAGTATAIQYSGNFAWSGMKLLTSGGTTENKVFGFSDSRQGADTTGEEILRAATWTAANFSDSDWTITDNAPPVLNVFDKSGVAQIDEYPAALVSDSGAGEADSDDQKWFTENYITSDTFSISKPAELAYLATLVNNVGVDFSGKTIKLTSNIDLSDYENWTPIGSGTSNVFKGTFDGAGYSIENLTINRSASYQALFGYLGGTVKNLAVLNVDIESTNGYVAGIVSYAYDNSTITDCFVTGKLKGSSFVGGVAGSGTNTASISHCYSTADIEATSNNAGGIAGMFTGTMTNCYSTGAVSSAKPVSGGTSTGVAGLVGYLTNDSKLLNSVALNPSVSCFVGGLGRIAGWFHPSNPDPTVTNCFAWDEMTLTYDEEVQTELVEVNDGISKSMEDIMKAETWTAIGFDASHWTVADDVPPILTAFNADIQISEYPEPVSGDGSGGDTEPEQPSPHSEWYAAEGAGTQAKPYQIGTADELAYLATLVNAKNSDTFEGKYIELTADIDLKEYCEQNTAAGGWVPIGETYLITGVSSSYKTFEGTFDGRGHIISNMTINRTGKAIDRVGLFGDATGATIKNLGVIGAEVTGVGAGIVTGRNGTIENCFTTGVVTGDVAAGTGSAGGISGTTNDNITNCYSTADVTSPYGAANAVFGSVSPGGGIAGVAANTSSATYTGLYSTGMISGGSGILGGLSYAGRTGQNMVALNPSVTANGSRITITDRNAKTLQNNFAWEGMLVGGATVAADATGTSRTHNCPADGERVHGESVTGNLIYSGEIWGPEYANFDTDVWDIERGRLPALRAFDLSVQPLEIPDYIMDTVTIDTGSEPEFVAVTSITGVPGAATAGTDLTLTGTVNPFNATNKTIAWSVKNAGTTGASVSGSTLRTTAAGTVVVTATVKNGAAQTSDYTEDFLVIVNESNVPIPVTGVTLDADFMNLDDSYSAIKLTATVEPSNATNKAVTWSSSNPSVAAASGDGLVSGAATGEAIITVTTVDGGFTATCKVEVNFEDDAPSVTYHTVTFNSNGGSAVARQSVAHNGKITQPANPTRTSYSFAGWYKEAALTNAWNFDTDTVTSDITLYAKWTDGYSTIGGGSSGGSGGGSGSGGGGSNTADTYTTSSTSSNNTPGDVSSAAASDAARAAAQAAKASGAATAKAQLRNPGNISLDALKAMANAAGMPLKLNADSMSADGKTVEVRLILDPSKATIALNLSASTSNSAATARESIFEKWFDNTVSVVSLGQQGSFGQSVEIAAKVDSKLDAKSLVFYSYDKTTNNYTRINDPAYWVDKNGYVHFTTTLAGDIIITNKPLARK